jgi:hypothetical protein
MTRHASAAAVLIVGAALGAAAALRFGLVEPVDVAQRCDETPWGSPLCALRTVAVQAFVHQRLGIAAFAIACTALAAHSSRVAAPASLIAGVLAALGLVLYGAGWSAPAAVLALLAWVSATPGTARAALPGSSRGAR